MIFPKLIQHFIFNTIPENLANHSMYAFVADNGKFTVFNREINKNAVSAFGIHHPELFENNQGAV